ncbi:MAG: hypothetical protein R3F17_08515 [Planctomycetota bacterium]
MAEYIGVERKPDYGPVRDGDVRHSLADISQARAQLGYEPVLDWRQACGRDHGLVRGPRDVLSRAGRRFGR